MEDGFGRRWVWAAHPVHALPAGHLGRKPHVEPTVGKPLAAEDLEAVDAERVVHDDAHRQHAPLNEVPHVDQPVRRCRSLFPPKPRALVSNACMDAHAPSRTKPALLRRKLTRHQR
eukprot:3941713-Rhodomonas_salina.3